MDIDLSVLRQLEREKEIPFEELVQIIEQAILTAYVKHTHQGETTKQAVEEEPEARVVLDRKSGHVDIFVPELDEDGNVELWDRRSGERTQCAVDNLAAHFA